MGANDYILAVYAVSGSLAVGCALLPGAGPIGRLVTIVLGIGLLSWTADAYLLDGWYLASPVVLVIPAALVGYAATVLMRLRYGPEDGWFTPVYRQTPGYGYQYTQQMWPDQPHTYRVESPGTSGDAIADNTPAPSDPWAALYASAEHERMRREPLRSRLARSHHTVADMEQTGSALADPYQAGLYQYQAPPVAPSPSPSPTASSTGRHAYVEADRRPRHASAEDDQVASRPTYHTLANAYASVEAEVSAWQERCSSRHRRREPSEFDGWGGLED